MNIKDEAVEAAKRIRDTAMQQTLAARIPESGHFGAIAQDADWLVDHLTAALPHMGGVSGLTVSAAIKDALRELDNVTAISDEDANCLGCAENLLRQALDALSPAPVGVTDEDIDRAAKAAFVAMYPAGRHPWPWDDADVWGKEAREEQEWWRRIVRAALAALASHEPAPEPAKDGT